MKKPSNKFHHGALTIIISMVILAGIADSGGSRGTPPAPLIFRQKLSPKGRKKLDTRSTKKDQAKWLLRMPA